MTVCSYRGTHFFPRTWCGIIFPAHISLHCVTSRVSESSPPDRCLWICWHVFENALRPRPLCSSTRILQRYVLEKAAPCLVATWPALQQAEAGQDILIVSNCAVQYRFKLGVMIVNHLNKFVCLFRYVYPCVFREELWPPSERQTGGCRALDSKSNSVESQICMTGKSSLGPSFACPRVFLEFSHYFGCLRASSRHRLWWRHLL